LNYADFGQGNLMQLRHLFWMHWWEWV